jgi:hypothetical protein
VKRRPTAVDATYHINYYILYIAMAKLALYYQSGFANVLQKEPAQESRQDVYESEQPPHVFKSETAGLASAEFIPIQASTQGEEKSVLVTGIIMRLPGSYAYYPTWTDPH